MEAKDREDLLKRPLLDLGGRHKRKRLEIVARSKERKDQEALPALQSVAAGDKEDAEVRRAAVEALAEIGGERAIPALASLLAAPASVFHGEVIAALAQIGSDRAVQAIIAAWSGADAALSATIGQALRKLGAGRTAGALVEALGHPAKAAREGASKTLAQMPEAIDPLIAALGDERAAVREGACALLAQRGQEAIAPLIAAYAGAGPRAREGVIAALTRMGGAAAPAVADLLQAPDAAGVELASKVLVGIGAPAVGPLFALAPGCAPAVELLLRMRAPARAFLAKTTDPQAAQAAFALEDAELREAGGQRLAKMGPASIPFLAQQLAEKGEPQAGLAATALATIGEPAVPALIAALNSADRFRSEHAAAALIKIGEPAATPLLREIKQTPGADQVLRRMGMGIIKPLLAGLKEGALREQASAALAALGPAALSPLFEALGSADEATWRSVRSTMIEASQRPAEELAQEFWRRAGDTAPSKSTENKGAARIAWCNRILRLDPELAQAHLALAGSYLLAEQPLRAREHAQRALEATHREGMEGKEAECYWSLARTYEMKAETGDQAGPRDAEQALEYYERAAALGIQNEERYRVLAEAAERARSQYLERVEHLDRILPLTRKVIAYVDQHLAAHRSADWDLPGRLEGTRNMVFEELDDVDAHEAAFAQRAVAGYHLGAAQNIEMLVNMVHLQIDNAQALQAGHLARAKSAIEEAIRLKPDYGAAYHVQGNILLAAREIKQAAAALETGIRHAPQYWQLYFALGDCLKSQEIDDLDGAMRVYREGLALNPAWAQGYSCVGGLYLGKQAFKEAVANFDKALALGDTQARRGRAIAYYQMENWGGFARDYQAVLKEDPDAIKDYAKLVYIATNKISALAQQGQNSAVMRISTALAEPLEAAKANRSQAKVVAAAYSVLANAAWPENYDPLERYDLAITLAGHAAQLDDQENIKQRLVMAISNKGRRYWRDNNYRAGLTYGQQATEIGEEFADGWITQAMCYEALGEETMMRLCLRRAAALGDEAALEWLNRLP